MTKNAFYFMLKALLFSRYSDFCFKIFRFLSCLFGQVGERLDKRAKVKFKIYNVTLGHTIKINCRSRCMLNFAIL